MTRSLFIVFALLCSLALFAQNQAADSARAAFRKGNYSRAIILYETAIKQTQDAKALRFLSREQENARECLQAKKKGDDAYSKGDYEVALRHYNGVADLNDSDTYVAQRIHTCRKEIAAAKTEKANNATTNLASSTKPREKNILATANAKVETDTITTAQPSPSKTSLESLLSTIGGELTFYTEGTHSTSYGNTQFIIKSVAPDYVGVTATSYTGPTLFKNYPLATLKWNDTTANIVGNHVNFTAFKMTYQLSGKRLHITMDYRMAGGIHYHASQTITLDEQGLAQARTNPQETVAATTSSSSKSSSMYSNTRSSYASSTSSSTSSYTYTGANSISEPNAGFYVGQEFKDGYVFWVNEAGTHGWIVTKTYERGKPHGGFPFRNYSNRQWRWPRPHELYHIYNSLKDKFPEGGYLARNKNGTSEVVNFTRKRAYSARTYGDYVYYLVAVAPF